MRCGPLDTTIWLSLSRTPSEIPLPGAVRLFCRLHPGLMRFLMYTTPRMSPLVHKKPLIAARILAPPGQALRTGGWGRLNFVMTEFSEVRQKSFKNITHLSDAKC